jgi:predicted RNA polymerase sigma factor
VASLEFGHLRAQPALDCGGLTPPFAQSDAENTIMGLHDEASRAEDTDWPQILALYELLKRMSDNPMVTLNHAVAAAMVHGPAKGLELLQALNSDTRIAGHHRLDSVRAHLLEMAGDYPAAITHYRIAASRTTSIAEQNYLIAQAARLSESITKASEV